VGVRKIGRKYRGDFFGVLLIKYKKIREREDVNLAFDEYW